MPFTKGQALWGVPIRYWDEDAVPHQAIADQDHDGSFTGTMNFYVHHCGYGHVVFVDPRNYFATREEAVAEIEVRRAQKVVKDREDWEAFLARKGGLDGLLESIETDGFGVLIDDERS